VSSHVSQRYPLLGRDGTAAPNGQGRGPQSRPNDGDPIMISSRRILGLIAIGMCIGVASGSSASAVTVRSPKATIVKASTPTQQVQFARLLIKQQTSLITSEVRTLTRAAALIRQQNPIVNRVLQLNSEIVGNPPLANQLDRLLGSLWRVVNRLQSQIDRATRLAVSTQGELNLNFARLDPATLLLYPTLQQQWATLQHESALTQVASTQLGNRPVYGLAAGTPSQ
jgi:hypothetical protein